MNPFSGIVLAGGLGMRARSAFLSGPKSMAPVANKPFLEYMLAKLRINGITDVVLCVGYRRSQIQSHFCKGTKWGLQLRYSVEEELLGTAGAVKKAASMMDASTLFVFNGDSFLDLDVQAMWDFHYDRKALATIALVELPKASRYSHVLINDHNEITAFRENGNDTTGDDNSKNLISAGTYLLSRQFIDSIPAERSVSIEKEMFPTLIGSGLYGFLSDGCFLDIGAPDDLARAQHELPMMLRA